MKVLAIAFAAMISANAMASCDKVDWSSPPAIPDGASASTTDMLAARAAVMSFVSQGENYLECGNNEPFMHNLIAHHLELTATAFNTELQRFMEQRSTIAAN